MKHTVLLALAGGVEVLHFLGLVYYPFAQLSEALLFRLPVDNIIGDLLGLFQCAHKPEQW